MYVEGEVGEFKKLGVEWSGVEVKVEGTIVRTLRDTRLVQIWLTYSASRNTNI